MDIYYEKAGEKIGPIAITDIEQDIISSETLVWHVGLKEWVKAKELLEFKDYLEKTPPPLPTSSKRNTYEKYDPTYEKETDATIFGIGIIIFSFVAVLIRNLEGLPDFYPTLMLCIGAIIAIGSSVYAYRTAKEQNRNYELWAILGLLTPAIALIILGQLSKLKVKKKSDFEKQLDDMNKTEIDNSK